MSDSAPKHPGRREADREVLQDEEHVSNSSAGAGALRAGYQLRGGEGVGGPADQNLSDELQSTREVPSLCFHQWPVVMVSTCMYFSISISFFYV